MPTNAPKGLNPEKWVENYADDLYNYAYSRLNNPDQARDIVQDTFTSAVKSAKNFKGLSTEKTWLYSILRNKIIDTYRSKAKYREISIDTSQNAEAEDSFFKENGHWTQAHLPRKWTIEPEKELETKEFYKILNNCIEGLNEKQAIVFRMKYLEHVASDAICKAMDITPSNYWVIIHRAKLLLRECLEKKWLAEKY